MPHLGRDLHRHFFSLHHHRLCYCSWSRGSRCQTAKAPPLRRTRPALQLCAICGRDLRSTRSCWRLLPPTPWASNLGVLRRPEGDLVASPAHLPLHRARERSGDPVMLPRVTYVFAHIFSLCTDVFTFLFKYILLAILHVLCAVRSQSASLQIAYIAQRSESNNARLLTAHRACKINVVLNV